jgi:hypothetical protein
MRILCNIINIDVVSLYLHTQDIKPKKLKDVLTKPNAVVALAVVVEGLSHYPSTLQ